jgi:hypothetical protein
MKIIYRQSLDYKEVVIDFTAVFVTNGLVVERPSLVACYFSGEMNK